MTAAAQVVGGPCDGCGGRPTAQCECRRCARETPDERYHACDNAACRAVAAAQHARVRGREASWAKL